MNYLHEHQEDEKIRDFLKDILIACEKHGLSIAHQDSHGAFLIQDYSGSNITWLLAAHDERGVKA